MSFKGTRFATMEDIKWNAMMELGRFQKKPSTEPSISDRMDGTSRHVRSQGPYFEGDYISVYVCPAIATH
jgi:hypothetical protein